MPGIVYYKYKLDKHRRVIRDEDGLALLKCTRGTNDVEATHRVINKMLGTSSCGEEFADGWALSVGIGTIMTQRCTRVKDT